MNMRNTDIKRILNGKCMTGRPVDFKIKTGKIHKFISDRRFGAFGEAYVYEVIIKSINDLTKQELQMLGYNSIEEYLSEPFNKNADKYTEKKFIKWKNFKFFPQILKKINY